mgnify:FL=1|jgi:hypothetical protein
MSMIDREKVLAVLLKRFPHAALNDVAAAANAIVGLEPEYTALEAADVTRFDCAAGQHTYSARHVANGEIRVFVKTRVAQKA